MKVTYSVVALFPFTSMGIIATKVVEELTKLGIDVGLNVLQEKDKIDYSLYSPAVQEALKKGFREDSIGIFFSYPDIYPAVRCKVNVGYTGADSSGWYQTEGQIPPAESCNKYTDYMLTPSDYSRQIMKNCGVSVPIYLFPHGIDPNMLVPITDREKGEQFIFSYVGELSRRKGTIDLIESFLELFDNNLKVHLLLRANTHMQYYDGQTILDLCKDKKNIKLVWDDKGQDDVSKYYFNSDCYIYPSRADWFGMTVFEALATGLPVIATSSNGYYEFLKDHIIGIKYSEQDIGNEHPYLKGQWNVIDKNDLKGQMIKTYFTYNLFSKYALRSATWLRENFTWEKVTKDYLLPFLEEIYTKHWEQEEAKNMVDENYKVTIGIPTKDRGIELGILLQSLLTQTYTNFDVTIVNDCHSNLLNDNSTLQGLFKLLNQCSNNITILEGERKGPHFARQKILDNAKTELILTLDDDVSLNTTCIQDLVNVFKEDKEKKVGAVGLVYLNPHESLQNQMLPQLTDQQLIDIGKIYWTQNGLYLAGILNINMHQDDRIKEVEHLYSGFMYRKSAAVKAGGYNLQLSKVGHREETLFSYGIYKQGYKVLVHPKCIAIHYHPMFGGIRETHGIPHGKENWDHDEKLFLEIMEKWVPGKPKPIDEVAVIVLTSGKDYTNFNELLESIQKNTTRPCSIFIVNNSDNTPPPEFDNIINKHLTNKMKFKVHVTFKDLPVGEARNEGVKLIPDNIKYFCFIDDDARILGRFSANQDWLDFLYDKFHSEPDIAAVAPIYTWFDPLKTDSVSVSCLFTSKKVWNRVGGFDPVFGNKEKGTWGYEDVDWSYRARRLGYKLKYVETDYFPFYHMDTTFKEKSDERIKGLQKAYDLLLEKYKNDHIDYFDCRTVFPFTKEQLEMRGTKLNIGCYHMYIDGWVNIDIDPDCRPDIVANAMDINYPNNSISIILASQFFEHLDPEDGKIILEKWYRMLKPGGYLIIEVPDCTDLEEKFKNGEITEEGYRTCLEGCRKKEEMIHKGIYTISEMTTLLQNSGFKDIVKVDKTSNNDPIWAMRFDCKK